MKSDIQLLQRDAKLNFALTDEARRRRAQALMMAGEIEVVNDTASQEKAVIAQAALHCALLEVRGAYKDLNAPLLEAQRKLRAVVANHNKLMEEEEIRIAKLTGEFQEIESAKLRSAEAARNAALLEIEQRRESALAKAESIEDREAIHARYAAEVADLGDIARPPKAAGQVVRSDWEFEVTDLGLLARVHPNLVKVEPRRAEIKEALRNGVQIVGLRAWKVTNSSVRGKSAPTVDIQTSPHGAWGGTPECGE